MELTCHLSGDLYIPHVFRIEKLTEKGKFVPVSDGSTYQVDSVHHTDFTYYRCVLKTITDRIESYTSPLFLAELSG